MAADPAWATALANLRDEISPPDRILEKGAIARELEFCTQHYYSHLMHALEVVAYRHTNAATASHAHDLFFDMCALFHLPRESRGDFGYRLRQIEWDGGDPADFKEAMAAVPSSTPATHGEGMSDDEHGISSAYYSYGPSGYQPHLECACGFVTDYDAGSWQSAGEEFDSHLSRVPSTPPQEPTSGNS